MNRHLLSAIISMIYAFPVGSTDITSKIYSGFIFITSSLISALLPPCFPDCWKVSLLVLVFKTVEQRSTKTSSKVFEKLVNYRIVDYEK